MPMRRALIYPAVYLALFAIASFMAYVGIFDMYARGALIIMTLPWTIVLYYGLGLFGVQLGWSLNNGESAVLGVGGALIQAAVLADAGARHDRKAASPPPASRARGSSPPQRPPAS